MMLNVPGDIIQFLPHIHLCPENIYAVRFNSSDVLKFQDMLQTMHCIELVTSGKIAVKHGQVTETVSTADIQFRKRGNYQLIATDDFSSLALFINTDFIKQFLPINFIPRYERRTRNNPAYRVFRSTAFINHNRDEVIRQINHPTSYSPLVIKVTSEQILLQLLASDQSSLISDLYALCCDSKVDLRYYMEINFTKQVSLTDLARETGRSLTVFKNEFSHIFHTTPVRWLTNRRLEHAAHLLRCTDESISQIAYANGFNNLSHFSKAYKLKFGVNATESRKRYRGGSCSNNIQD